jgi:hypothetical protein
MHRPTSTDAVVGWSRVAVARGVDAYVVKNHHLGFAECFDVGCDPNMFGIKDGMMVAHFAAGRYTEALSWAKATLREKPGFVQALCTAAASAALVGQSLEAERAVATLR